MFALCEGSVVDLEDSFEHLMGNLPKIVCIKNCRVVEPSRFNDLNKKMGRPIACFGGKRQDVEGPNRFLAQLTNLSLTIEAGFI